MLLLKATEGRGARSSHNRAGDAEAGAASRVSGIRANLDYAYRAIEMEDIEERLTRIEEAIAEGNLGDKN